ncbi:MAG: hypothetical protein KGO50_07375 [Myxococcales bacterium]|nr:hypothetical protein [Myxococcales bacterium]
MRQSPRQLFHPRVLRNALMAWSRPADLQEQHKVVLNVGKTLQSGALDNISEIGFHADFLEIFRRALGYRTVADGQGATWELTAEQGIPGAARR